MQGRGVRMLDDGGHAGVQRGLESLHVASVQPGRKAGERPDQFGAGLGLTGFRRRNHKVGQGSKPAGHGPVRVHDRQFLRLL